MESSVSSVFNNSNGLGSGTYSGRQNKRKKKDSDTDIYEDFMEKNIELSFRSIFDELAMVVSYELKEMERSRKQKIQIDTNT